MKTKQERIEACNMLRASFDRVISRIVECETGGYFLEMYGETKMRTLEKDMAAATQSMVGFQGIMNELKAHHKELLVGQRRVDSDEG